MLRVNGGPANSGTVVKRVRGDEWTHSGIGRLVVCKDRVLAGYWTKCPDCGAKRP